MKITVIYARDSISDKQNRKLRRAVK